MRWIPRCWEMALSGFGTWSETYFYDANQVVDWYHATEHLALAAHSAFGEGSAEAFAGKNNTRRPFSRAMPIRSPRAS